MNSHPYRHSQKPSQQGLLTLDPQQSNATLSGEIGASASPLFTENILPPRPKKKWYQKSVCCCRVPTAIAVTTLVLAGIGMMVVLLWPHQPTFRYVGTQGDTSLQTINSTSFGVNITILIEIQNDNRIDLNLQNIKADGYYYMLPTFPVATLDIPNIRIPRRAVTQLSIPLEVIYNMDNDPGGYTGIDLVRSCGLFGAELSKPLLGSYNVSIEATLLRFKDPVVIEIKQELNIPCPFNISTLPSILDSVLPPALVNILLKTSDNLDSVVGTVNGVTNTVSDVTGVVNNVSSGNVGGVITGVGKTVDTVKNTVNDVGNAISGIFG